jgi:hypothetical protein
MSLLRINRFLKCASLLIAIVLVGSFGVTFAAAEDTAKVLSAVPVQATVEKKYFGGRIEVSPPLWTGSVPTSISFTKVQASNEFRNYRSFAAVTFAIQSLVPYAEASNASTALNVKFELWTVQGEKVAEHWVSGTDWNPLGGPTVVRWTEIDVWDISGTYNLIIKTHKIIDTNGLISLYQDGLQTIPFKIELSKTSKKSISCSKGKVSKKFRQQTCPPGWKVDR